MDQLERKSFTRSLAGALFETSRRITFFVHFLLNLSIKLASPQAAWLSIFWSKISGVAPPFGT